MRCHPSMLLCLILVGSGQSAALAGRADRIHQVETGVPEFTIDFQAGVPWDRIGKEPGSARILDRMAHYGVPGVGVAVIEGDSVIWARGYGRLAAGTKTPVTADTPFEAASTTKTAVAVAVLHLADRGDLDLDRDVNTYLTSWKVPENEFTAKEKVTLRRLLTHTAGLNRPDGGFSVEEGGAPTTLQVLQGEAPATNAPLAVERVPGSEYAYSNFGYVVIQQVLADVGGKSFPEVMKSTVFAPLGLDAWSFDPARWPAGSLPAPHGPAGERLESAPGHGALAPGGLWATPDNLARVAVAILNGYRGEPGSVVSARVARWMLIPEVKIDPAENLGFSGLGLGVYLIRAESGTAFCHPGFNEPGATSMLIAFPETGQGAVVMTNGARGLELTFEILSSIAREYKWPALR